MRTSKIVTYTQFVKLDRPYLPTPDSKGTLLLPNFSINGNASVSHKRRLVITSGVIYNTRDLCVVWSICLSCQGTRYRWQYFRRGQKTSWYKLSWDEKRKVIRAYVAKQAAIPFYTPPTKNYRKWITL